jgi:hypothetical protein
MLRATLDVYSTDLCQPDLWLILTGGKGQKGKHAVNMLPQIITVMQGINFLFITNCHTHLNLLGQTKKSVGSG